jgi:ligand-binding sensor protein
MKPFFVGSIPADNVNPENFPVVELGEEMSELLSVTLSGIAFYPKNSHILNINFEHDDAPYSEIINELDKYCVVSDDSKFSSCDEAFHEIIEAQDAVGK